MFDFALRFFVVNLLCFASCFASGFDFAMVAQQEVCHQAWHRAVALAVTPLGNAQAWSTVGDDSSQKRLTVEPS